MALISSGGPPHKKTLTLTCCLAVINNPIGQGTLNIAAAGESACAVTALHHLGPHRSETRKSEKTGSRMV